MVGVALTVWVSAAQAKPYSELVRKRLVSACTALLAVTTVGITAFEHYHGDLRERGFGTRIVWSSNRRAISVFLAKAFGIRTDDQPEALAEEEFEEVRWQDPAEVVDLEDLTYEEVQAGTIVTEDLPDRVRGSLIARGRRIRFELIKRPNGKKAIFITTSRQ